MDGLTFQTQISQIQFFRELFLKLNYDSFGFNPHLKAWPGRKLFEKILPADFRGKHFNAANFKNSTLINTSFWQGNIEGTNFSDANLTGANLSGTHAKNSIFKNAVLRNVSFKPNGGPSDFNGSDFSNADLSGANLDGANFSDANFSNSILQGTFFSSSTIFPLGFNPHLNGMLGPGRKLFRRKFYRADFRESISMLLISKTPLLLILLSGKEISKEQISLMQISLVQI